MPWELLKLEQSEHWEEVHPGSQTEKDPAGYNSEGVHKDSEVHLDKIAAGEPHLGHRREPLRQERHTSEKKMSEEKLLRRKPRRYQITIKLTSLPYPFWVVEGGSALKNSRFD